MFKRLSISQREYKNHSFNYVGEIYTRHAVQIGIICIVLAQLTFDKSGYLLEYEAATPDCPTEYFKVLVFNININRIIFLIDCRKLEPLPG